MIIFKHETIFWLLKFCQNIKNYNVINSYLSNNFGMSNIVVECRKLLSEICFLLFGSIITSVFTQILIKCPTISYVFLLKRPLFITINCTFSRGQHSWLSYVVFLFLQDEFLFLCRPLNVYEYWCSRFLRLLYPGFWIVSNWELFDCEKKNETILVLSSKNTSIHIWYGANYRARITLLSSPPG